MRKKALDYLARREHSRTELKEKLLKREFSTEEIEPLLDQLQAENLQSDRRFAEAYVRSRLQRGFGPRVIEQELQQRGIEQVLTQDVFCTMEVDWQDRLAGVWRKKFGQLPGGAAGYARQYRFLLQRGFCPDTVRQLLKELQNG